ncbi:uncharacterized protein LOC112637433 [Camponotus floridanus]|uniref:uncharacterized protein LOC112637433 n=1 Tax=Camponotus floridanus TaxID=104421 RepID=UPI000DC68777|nr:uncharacterized protein LOC112637433 [Camponotus floridanus]
MKQQFDAHHGARPRSFVIGQSVLIQLSNGQRIPGKIVRLIGKALTRVSFEGGFITRHFNQIWNRPKRQEKKSNTISEDLLPSGKESARIQPDPVLHTSLREREEAEPLSNGTTQLPVASARRSENPSGATQPPVAAARRSERLSHQIRPDFKALGGTRPYRGQHS